MRANFLWHVSMVATLYVTLLVLGCALHIVLRAYKIPSRFGETFRLYTLVMAPLAPFVTLVTIPPLEHTVRVAAADAPILRSVVSLARTWATYESVDARALNIVAAIFHPLVVLAALFLLAAFAKLVSERYGVDVRRVTRAVALTVAVLLPLIAGPLIALQHALLFATT